MPDTTVAINDSVRLWVHSPVTKSAETYYLWSFDGGLQFTDTVWDTCLTAQWGKHDLGNQTVVVFAEDIHGRRSLCDTIRIEVKLYRPQTTLSCPESTVSINDTVVFTANAQDTNGLIHRYRWQIDSLEPFSNNRSELAVSWDRLRSGKHTVYSQVQDDDSLWSTPQSLTITVTASPPVILPLPDTSWCISDSCRIAVRGHDSDGKITEFFWSIDDSDFQSVSDSLIPLFAPKDTGTISVRIYAHDEDTLSSDTIHFSAYISPCPPSISLPQDTSIYLHDSLVIAASTSDPNGRVAFTRWSRSSSLWSDTTTDNRFTYVARDTSSVTMYAQAIDDDGMTSPVESLQVSALMGYPTVEALDSVDAYIHNEETFTTSAVDPNGRVEEYEWRIIDSDVITFTESPFFSHTWTADTHPGYTKVLVRVRDNDSLWSDYDTIQVSIKAQIPTVSISPSMAEIFIDDTLPLEATGHDSLNSIIGYQWQIDDFPPVRSNDSVSLYRSEKADGPHTVRVWAINELGVFSKPESCRVQVMKLTMHYPRDTVWARLRRDNSIQASVPFQFSPGLPNAPAFPISYSLYVSETFPFTAPAFVGTDTLAHIDQLDTGLHHWRLEANTSTRNRSSIEGTIVSSRQKTICFAGHSIAVGMGGDWHTGGFRRSIIDSLRSVSGYSAIAPIGPFTTPYMQQNPENDSCLAISGKLAREIYYQLLYDPSLTADIWVVMVGVNNYFYGGNELHYTSRLIDEITRRNNQGHVFVLNGIQLSDTIYENESLLPADSIQAFRQRLFFFNDMLKQEIDTRREDGMNVYLIDAFRALSPDSTFQTKWMTDHLHPNQTGYEVLADTILKSMFDNGVHAP